MKSFLLVSNGNKSAWSELLRDYLSELGLLILTPEALAVSKISHEPFDLIIIDAGEVEEPLELVSRLSAACPDARIVVTNADPSWEEAREALRAGAADYFRQSLNRFELLSIIQQIPGLRAHPEESLSVLSGG